MTFSELHRAFHLLKLRNQAVALNQPFDSEALSEMALLFGRLTQTLDLLGIIQCGSTFGLAPAYVISIIILHGGYFRLISSGIISRSETRHIDSLYNPPYPPLLYNAINQDLCAPWITLSAQEALLDMDLASTSVIEYGSGISTFFFARSCHECVSFESDSYPEGGTSWTSSMSSVSTTAGISLRLLNPDLADCSPQSSLSLLTLPTKILVNIDGEDRTRHFRDWASWLIETRSFYVVLLIDNSEYSPFVPIFQSLKQHGAIIYHHYGPVYGRLVGKQCTSFVTFNPWLMTSNVAPNTHDSRWGRMETQSK